MSKNTKPIQEDITNHLLQQIANLTLENASLKSIVSQYQKEDREIEGAD